MVGLKPCHDNKGIQGTEANRGLQEIRQKRVRQTTEETLICKASHKRKEAHIRQASQIRKAIYSGQASQGFEETQRDKASQAFREIQSWQAT